MCGQGRMPARRPVSTSMGCASVSWSSSGSRKRPPSRRQATGVWRAALAHSRSNEPPAAAHSLSLLQPRHSSRKDTCLLKTLPMHNQPLRPALLSHTPAPLTHISLSQVTTVTLNPVILFVRLWRPSITCSSHLLLRLFQQC